MKCGEPLEHRSMPLHLDTDQNIVISPPRELPHEGDFE
jgi:hypothetical protein